MRYVTTEMINLPDYGTNAKYSLIEQNIACAKWIRATWEELSAVNESAAEHMAGITPASGPRQA
jgi:hypothetical protein